MKDNKVSSLRDCGAEGLSCLVLSCHVRRLKSTVNKVSSLRDLKMRLRELGGRREKEGWYKYCIFF
ncbi:MAG: hypothetical protein LBU62_10685 [Bacteroidales bacterium]|nr:hypothetical protein [Bacteroidales bacterium]